MAKTLEEQLRSNTVEGQLYEKLEAQKVKCFACAHECLIPEGKDGICKVRFNDQGTLKVPWGYVAGLNADPIEKKPFFHVYPGSIALSFGMLGCDFHCAYCQNWVSSQTLRDNSAGAQPQKATPEQIISLAIHHGARTITSTYNEPLITSEWAVEIFKHAKQNNLSTSYVSNGNANPKVLEYLAPWLDSYKIDLKTFNDKHYRSLGGKLESVLNTIEWVFQHKLWVEIVTLVVPGFNNSKEELTSIANFIKSISPSIPWHVTAFHPDYNMRDPQRTSIKDLLTAYEAGKEAGLHFVYAGNLPGMVGNTENTYCPFCNDLLVERTGFWVQANYLKPGGLCPKCKKSVPGKWD